jgi:GNAT superfamily N-acetyltransferase
MHITIRPFEANDYAAVAALNNTNFPEFGRTPEKIEFEDAHRPSHCRAARWVAEYDHGPREVVGYAEYDQIASVYHPRRFLLDVVVRPACFGQGIGRRLFGAVLDGLRGHDPLSVSLWTREDMPCRLSFLERRGFVPEMRLWSSELDLLGFEPAGFLGALEVLDRQGIAVRSLTELEATDPDHERKLYGLWQEVHDDVPIPPGLEHRHRTFEDWRERNLEHPTLLPALYLVALEGEEYVAMTNLWRSPEPARLRTGLTGVRRAYRGRGIALGLKVWGLAAAKALGYASVCTENASSNGPMLAINDRLGFVRRPPWVHYTASWDALVARGYVSGG